MKYDRYDNPGALFTLVVVLLFLFGAVFSFMAMTNLFTVSPFQSQHSMLIAIQVIALLMTSRIVFVYFRNRLRDNSTAQRTG